MKEVGNGPVATPIQEEFFRRIQSPPRGEFSVENALERRREPVARLALLFRIDAPEPPLQGRFEVQTPRLRVAGIEENA